MMMTNFIGFRSLGNFTISFLIVFVTSDPANIAPLSSKMAAMTRACFSVSVFAPTLVPKLFATSFPPILNAIKRPNMPAIKNKK